VASQQAGSWWACTATPLPRLQPISKRWVRVYIADAWSATLMRLVCLHWVPGRSLGGGWCQLGWQKLAWLGYCTDALAGVHAVVSRALAKQLYLFLLPYKYNDVSLFSENNYAPSLTITQPASQAI